MKKLLLLLIIGSMLVACEKEEEKVVLPFAGEWSLMSYTKAGVAPETFAENEIIWEFKDQFEILVTINTTLPPTSHIPFQTSGYHEYTGSPKVVSIEGVQYAVTIENNTLDLFHNDNNGGTHITFSKRSQ